MSIRFKEGIDTGHASLLCKWSNEQGQEFQEQWMGPLVPFPLTCDKVAELDHLFSIFHEEDFIGVIQEIRIDKNNIHIGRFLTDPQKQGMGLGTEALKGFMGLLFKNRHIRSITLTVFDYNQKAIRLYEKHGFEIEETVEVPKLKYVMRKQRTSYRGDRQS